MTTNPSGHADGDAGSSVPEAARAAAEGQADAKALWRSLPLGSRVFVAFLGGEPRAAHTSGDGWVSDDGMTGCTPWSVRLDEVWVPATTVAAAVAEERATTGRRIEAARQEGFEQGLRDAADEAGSWGSVQAAQVIRAKAGRVRAALASPGEET